MTIQQLANYLGQEVIINDNLLENIHDRLTYLNELGDCGGNAYEWQAKDCRLVLTPLSKITDEDKKKLTEMAVWTTDINHFFEACALQIDFLRSRGYAVGLKEDEFIDKTK